ncbi:MAG TPA: nucleotide exchange factor GrpE [Xanthobacteraceae bacterium]|jgi:molecular chaperone GrpE|nr:nucleotide exchange factor GrpE [Xanthobacteraceae bacterium]
MTDQTARAEDEAAKPQEEAAAQDAAPQAGQPDPVAVAVELRDRLLRSLAEMDNLRKRTDREVAESRVYGVTSFARDILGVADNMRRALDAVTPELRAGAEASVQALIDGVELTERELIKALEKNGVRQFSPQGEKFDPNLHQAMYEVPDVSVPAGSVVQVVQPGYKIGERMLRPAMVGVSKGGPKVAPTSSNDNARSAAN